MMSRRRFTLFLLIATLMLRHTPTVTSSFWRVFPPIHPRHAPAGVWYLRRTGQALANRADQRDSELSTPR